ncbi:unnamed protein product [Lactuca saligna]|uniref:Uncharacterized protein n=1 Tax=Lactuca saligna TaxID=75948 RepID=A0AA35YIS9_LACSI|nr:unnamed protein product [Lactuca saligna]
MTTITIRKYLAEKLRLVFAMLHHLEVPLVVKKEPKLKEKLVSDEPIINDGDEEVPDEEELKRLKARDAKIDEHQRIIQTGDMDVEVAAVLQKKHTGVLKESPNDFEKLKLGKMYSKEWYVVYQARD